MKSYIITTDSGCDLSNVKCAAADVHMIPMQVMIGDEVLLDTADTEKTLHFYQRMRDGAMPKTSQLNVADCLEYWKTLLPEKLPILHIALGSAISGTAHNAQAAADELMEEYPEAKVYVVDSTTASTGYGLMVMEAVRMRDEGKSAEECAAYLNEIKPHVQAYLTTSDLTWLQKGGRVSKTAAVLGSMLRINPIINLDLAGALQVIDKVRGSKNAMRKIVSVIEETVIDPESQTLYISHADNPEAAEAYKKEILSRVPFKDVDVNYIGTIIGAHTGPGLVVAFWKGTPRLPKADA